MILLCILDGFGFRDPYPDNAVAAASKPNFDNLLKQCNHTLIDGSGIAVGLPAGQMGNSEVGHLNLGAGRVVYQDISRIDSAIENGHFFDNGVLTSAMEKAVEHNKAVHLFGLVSNGKVHSSLGHLYALIELAKKKNVSKLYLHAFMDGRDTTPTSGIEFMRQTLAKFDEIGLGKVATLGGRYYGMDRDKRWERTEKAYRSIVHGEGERYKDPIQAIQKSYDDGVTDEFIIPVVIENDDEHNGRLQDGDTCIMFNFRADRARQLSYMFTGHKVENYQNNEYPKIDLVTMTDFDKNLSIAKVAFEPILMDNILGQILSENNLNQLRTAETEKYAHVTFFFNGGVEKPFDGEDRDMIPSPKIATYDLQPEMSAPEVTKNAVGRIESGKYDFVLLNYANCDMVGHTGDFDAAKKAVEAVDSGLGQLLEAVKEQNGIALITADHGNAEMMIEPSSGGPWTAHTTNLVPFVIYDPSNKIGDIREWNLRESGILADIAPTILELLDIESPTEMTGNSLIKRG
jgi:2,3-bisphosphoglycerate-independent phosphoglycerate mutase